MEWLINHWVEIVKIFGLALTLIAAAGGSVGIIDQIKKMLGIDGTYAQIVAFVVQAIIGLLTAVVGGQILPEMFASPIDLLVLIVTIALGSNQIYQVRKRN